MSLKTDNVNNGYLFFNFFFDTKNELQKSHFDHKNLVYVYHLYVGVLFAFHEIEFNSHVRKIYFKAHINDNNE